MEMAKWRIALAGTAASMGLASLVATGLPNRSSRLTRSAGDTAAASRRLRSWPVTASTGRPPWKVGSTRTFSITRAETGMPRPA